MTLRERVDGYPLVVVGIAIICLLVVLTNLSWYGAMLAGDAGHAFAIEPGSDGPRFLSGFPHR